MSATSRTARREVRVESDPKTLLQALKVTFTRPKSVLGELLQNGRRAGATQIDITVSADAIIVRDNGCGIADPAILLNIAVSGWDEATQQADACYGLGFIATLFCCASLEVTSRGQRILAKTADLIECKPVGLASCPDDGRTMIRLQDHTLGKPEDLERELQRLCRGFPIEVVVNGRAQPRDHAMDNGNWVESPMGWTRPDDILNRRRQTLFYLQGLPIGVASRLIDAGRGDYADNRVVHLRSPLVKGRLPERDSVLDPEEVGKLVHASRLALARSRLEELVAAGKAEELCGHADVIEETKSFDLLESLQVVPPAWLRELTEQPRHGLYHAYVEWQDQPSGPVAFDVVQSRGIWEPDDTHADMPPMRAYHYVRARNGFLAACTHQALEWISDRFGIRKLAENDMIVTPIEVRATQEEGFLEADGVIACKTIAFDHPVYGPAEGGKLPESALSSDDRLLVTSINVDTEVAVKQIADFIFDDDEDEDAVWRATKDLDVILAQLFNGKDLSAVLRRVLDTGSEAMDRLLKNARFTVSFDGHGRPTVEEIKD